MYEATRCVELVFPRSGQILPVEVPVEIFELVQTLNQLLLSFIFCKSVPISYFERLGQGSFPT